MKTLSILLITLAAVTAQEPSDLPAAGGEDTTSIAPPDPATDAPMMSTFDMEPTTTEEMVPASCDPSLDEIQGVFNYTNAPEFKDLSENQQILIYELLAAGEACKLRGFITPETAQRVFLLVEDLPLKYVYLFVRFLSRNLEREGVVVPV